MMPLDYLEPLRDKVSQKSAYLGVAVAIVIYFFSMFLPWTSIRGGLYAIDGGSVNGWSEWAFIAILPISPSVFMILIKNKSTKINTLLFCIMLSLFLLAYNNILHRSQWASVEHPRDISGSELDVGFWIGTLALSAISVFSLGWTLHTLPTERGSSAGSN